MGRISWHWGYVSRIPENPFSDKKMPGIVSVDDALPSYFVYFKLCSNSEMPKLHIETLDKLRFRHTKDDVRAEMI